MNAANLRKVGLALAAPVLAILVAVALTTLILIAAGDPVLAVWQVLFKAPLPRQVVAILNEATVLYLSAVAVAIGFKMGLFNIGVDGQYRIASFAAAVFAGANFLPGWLNIIVSILDRHGDRRALGADRRPAQGGTGGQRGDQHDHAELHRHLPGRLPAQGRGREGGGQQRHQHPRAGRGLPGPGHQRPGLARHRPRDLRADLPGHPGRHRLLVHARQDPVRLRPARHRRLPDRGHRQRREGEADGRHGHGALRGVRRAGGHAAAVRTGLRLRRHRPGRARVRRALGRPARPQPSRSAWRSPPCCGATSAS